MSDDERQQQDLDRFRAQLPEVLQRLDQHAVETRSRLEGWLVSISVGLLALPTLLTDQFEANSRFEWWLVLVATVLLLASIFSILLRHAAALVWTMVNANLASRLDSVLRANLSAEADKVEQAHFK